MTPAAEDTPIILQPAKLDERSTVILCAVWNAWAEGSPGLTYDDLSAVTGIKSKGALYNRLKVLEADGWVRRPAGVRLPGPRLFAVSNGVPLELVGAWKAPARSRRRTPN